MTSTETKIDNADVAAVPVVATSPSLVNTYVAAYRKFGKATALSILDMCRVLLEAKQQLRKDEFQQFCEGVGLKPAGSMFSKLKAIGEADCRLRALGDRLPHNWTTQYELAKRPAGQFADIEAKIESSMTAADIRGLLPPSAVKPRLVEHRPISSGSVVSIALGKSVTREAFLRALESLKQTFEFTIVDSADPPTVASDQENAPLELAA
ncbi:hypothetical protein [Nostoc linckia]|uniref:hypothetical protein n=1 Tax=Nostoc linckia TaxID=92942 RepID=UPI000BFFDA33|nr:hypothetical protein [Nostoc linckia]PHJ94588.1 hypothetical protein VF09_37010 [Nostoc linckia z9]